MDFDGRLGECPDVEPLGVSVSRLSVVVGVVEDVASDAVPVGFDPPARCDAPAHPLVLVVCVGINECHELQWQVAPVVAACVELESGCSERDTDH